MIYYLGIDFWDNIIDGYTKTNHKFLTIVYKSYCNILSSSHNIVLISKSHGVYHGLGNNSWEIRK